MKRKLEMEWKPIETAPKADWTNRKILVYDPRMNEPVEIRLADGDWWRKHGGPTHWMPLPAPPKA
jgi:hypothetical protein